MKNKDICKTNREPPDYDPVYDPVPATTKFKNPMQIEERRLFTYEERLEILKSTKGVCAHCGKPLKTSTMTVEHIIPIMRGGTNSMENLTALCEECNTMKNNLIYLPKSFYMAIMGTGRYNQMEHMVKNWYREKMTEELDIQMFPLIAPIHQMIISMSSNVRNIRYNKQLILQWMLVGKEQKEETEAITGQSVKTIRALLRREINNSNLEINLDDYFKDCETDEDYEEKGKQLENLTKQKYCKYIPVTCYTLRKLTSDKLFAMVAVRYDKEKHDAVIYLPWANMTKKAIPKILYHFLNLLFYAIVDVSGNMITDFVLLSPHKNAFDSIKTGYINTGRRIAYMYSEFELQDKQDPEKITYGVQVDTYPQNNHKTVHDYFQIPSWTNLILKK